MTGVQTCALPIWIPEAKAAYKRLAEEFPTSVYQGEARRKSEFLETARQG